MLDLIIVGAGPAGMATAIAAGRAGLDYLVIEKGALVNSILHFPTNMVFFTTPELLEIGGIPFTTPFQKPTRMEALRYYRRVCDAFRLEINFDEKVERIEHKAGVEGKSFAVETSLPDGTSCSYRAGKVVLATGYYDHPNLLGVAGEDLAHVSHYYSEAHRFFRKRVVVVGGNNSAAEAALELFRAGALVTLVHRGGGVGRSIKYWVRPDIENRIKEGSIAARFSSSIAEIRRSDVLIDSGGSLETIPADAVFLMTGYHPDVELLRGAGVKVRPETLAPEYDSETFETNVPGLYLAGAVVSGRENNQVFIENGRFHGEAIVKALRCANPEGRSGLI